jgi:hypothetical protein
MSTVSIYWYLISYPEIQLYVLYTAGTYWYLARGHTDMCVCGILEIKELFLESAESGRGRMGGGRGR